MADNKTKPNQVSVESYLATISDKRQEEARQLIKIMQEVSGEPPVMWGPSMIGFGQYHYVYPSGREGDTMLIGFSPRQAKISLYITMDAAKYKDRLDAMGKHDTGKGCIYINKLADVDMTKLRELMEIAYKDAKETDWTASATYQAQ